jgi:hypothetical protein
MDTFKSTLNSLKKSIYPKKSKSPDDGKTVKNNTLNENRSQKNKKTKFEKLKTYVQNTFPTMSATNVGLTIVAIVVLGKIGISRNEIMNLMQEKWGSLSTDRQDKSGEQKPTTTTNKTKQVSKVPMTTARRANSEEEAREVIETNPQSWNPKI